MLIGITLSSCVTNHAITEVRNVSQKSENVVSSSNFTSTNNSLALMPYSPLPVRGFALSKPLVFEAQPIQLAESEISELYTYKELEAFNKIEVLLNEARSYLGTRYRFGGSSRAGIDCSSFVLKSFNAIDIQLPRTSRDQSLLGEYVFPGELRKGDLLFFSQRGNRISHVGIVESIDEETGKVYFIHAASSLGVTISSLDDPYWKKRFKRAKRIIGVLDEQNPDSLTNN